MVWVGFAQSVSGVASLFMAPVAGCLVDAWPECRARLARASALLALMAVLCQTAVLLTDQQVLVLATRTPGDTGENGCGLPSSDFSMVGHSIK